MTNSAFGWFNNDINFHWLRKIFKFCSRSGQIHFFLMDSHSFHLSPNFFRFAVDHGILLVCLLLHTTQHLQLLNVKFFSLEVHYLHAEMLKFFFATATVFSNTEMLQCINATCFPTFTWRNIRSTWRQTGIEPFHPAMILDGLTGDRLSTPEHAGTMGSMLALATPKTPGNMDALINHMISTCNLTPSRAEMLGKMSKAYKRTTADLELKDKEAKDLKKAAERKQKKKKIAWRKWLIPGHCSKADTGSKTR